MSVIDYITPQDAQTLPGLLKQRAMRSPASIAYEYYDDKQKTWQQITWQNTAEQVKQFQAALQQENLSKGDRVAIMLRNCPEWIIFDIAAQGLGFVSVPLYTNDRADNVAYVVQDAEVKVLLIQNQRQWRELSKLDAITKTLQRVICVEPIAKEAADQNENKLTSMQAWLATNSDTEFVTNAEFNDLATIVYTSGTTGRPKGVMLSHKNILSNAYAALHCGTFFSQDVFLSFLPLSHTLERSAGCFLPMMANAKVCFARSIQTLAEDIKYARPTIFVSVPRIYEMIYTKVLASLQQQSAFKQKLFAWTLRLGWRRFQFSNAKATWHIGLIAWPLLNKLVASKIKQNLGGRLRYAIVGGAALSKTIAKFFVSLEVPLYQGYGMTESSPVISAGRQDDNDPFSIGKALPGIDVRLTSAGELCTRSDCVMLGYYKNQQATDEVIDEQGWLHTGDIAQISEEGYLYITGRIKDIIVLASAEKVPPQDMETAICADPLFEQALVLGEGKPYLAALLVLCESEWKNLAARLEVEEKKPESLRLPKVQKFILKRISTCLKEFPGYAQIRRVSISLEPWSIENGLLTPTLKTKRPQLIKEFAQDIEDMYESLG